MPHRARPGRCLLLVWLMLVTLPIAGCSGDEPTVAASSLPKLVLQPEDVGDGYQRFDEGRLAMADLPTGERANPGRFGREDGWKARYRSGSDSGPSAGEVVESRADLFAEADGAKQELAAHRRELTDPSSSGGALESTPGLGDEAYVLTRPPLPGGEATFVTVLWRYRNVTASVLLAGVRPEAPDEALRLARKQQVRLVAAEQK